MIITGFSLVSGTIEPCSNVYVACVEDLCSTVQEHIADKNRTPLPEAVFVQYEGEYTIYRYRLYEVVGKVLFEQSSGTFKCYARCAEDAAEMYAKSLENVYLEHRYAGETVLVCDTFGEDSEISIKPIYSVGFQVSCEG